MGWSSKSFILIKKGYTYEISDNKWNKFSYYFNWSKGTRYILTFEDDESRDKFLKEYMLEMAKKEDDE